MDCEKYCLIFLDAGGKLWISCVDADDTVVNVTTGCVVIIVGL